MKLLAVMADGFADVRAHAGRTTLQTLGVVLGVASVVAALGMMAGGKQKSMEYYQESGGALKVIVYPKPLEAVRASARQKASLGLTLSDVRAIRARIPGFDLVEPEVNERLLCRTPQLTRTREVTGTGTTYMGLNELILERGRGLTDEDMARASAVCVLGADRADEFFGTSNPLGKTITLGRGSYRVVGLLKHREFYWNTGGGYNALGWMNRVILVPATSLLAREVGAGSDKADQIVLRLASAKSHDEAVPALKRLLLSRHGAEDFQVYDRQERLQRMDQEGRIYDITFLACGIISLLVGGIVVANILLASFTERIREVGVRKALGAKGWHIAVQCLVESVVVSVFGGAVGLVLGVGFVHAIAALLDQPTALTPAMVIAAVVCAGIVGVIFGFAPAVKAARLDPVVALRYE
jgi:putative ABC transport system permease protein